MNDGASPHLVLVCAAAAVLWLWVWVWVLSCARRCRGSGSLVRFLGAQVLGSRDAELGRLLVWRRQRSMGFIAVCVLAMLPALGSTPWSVVLGAECADVCALLDNYTIVSVQHAPSVCWACDGSCAPHRTRVFVDVGSWSRLHSSLPSFAAGLSGVLVMGAMVCSY